MKSKSIQEDELLNMWVGWFILCLSPHREVRFAILERSVVVLSFLYHWFKFMLKYPSAITKKSYLELVLGSLWILGLIRWSIQRYNFAKFIANF